MRCVALVLILICPAILLADILHLTDGSRYSGEVVSQSATEIVFRVRRADGSATVTRRFPAASVARLERIAGPAGTTRPESPADADLADAASLEHRLRAGLARLDAGDPVNALRAFQAVVLEATVAQRARLNALTLAERGSPLDELLARTRVAAAEERDRGRGFRLTYATPYERPALARQLTAQQAERLARVYRGRSVEAWLAAREEYTTVADDTRALVADVTRAAALIGVRLRLDPALKSNRPERIRLVALRADLGRLGAHLLALRGYTAGTGATDPEDPAEQAARRLAGELAAATQPAPGEAEEAREAGPPASQPDDDLGILPRD